jgi:catechol 2,3-dioxygenase-like lactoylglutathione lyase family enzyme
MTHSIFENASMVSTVVRVRDVAASVAWYREKLGLEPIHVGADGPEHPIAVYAIAGAVVSLWQLPAGQARVPADNDRNSYVCIISSGDLKSSRQALIEGGVDVGEIRRSANNEFVWFHDLDGNRFELSRPLPGRTESALVARESREER